MRSGGSTIAGGEFTYPMDPPGGTMATSRSNALQLLVYISRTRARGTSALLNGNQQMNWLQMPFSAPIGRYGYVPSLLAWILRWMRIEIVEPCREVMLGGCE